MATAAAELIKYILRWAIPRRVVYFVPTPRLYAVLVGHSRETASTHPTLTLPPTRLCCYDPPAWAPAQIATLFAARKDAHRESRFVLIARHFG